MLLGKGRSRSYGETRQGSAREQNEIEREEKSTLRHVEVSNNEGVKECKKAKPREENTEKKERKKKRYRNASSWTSANSAL